MTQELPGLVFLAILGVVSVLPGGVADAAEASRSGSDGAGEQGAGSTGDMMPRRTLELTVAPAFRAVRDDLLVPLASQGGGPELQIRYQQHVGRGLLVGAIDAELAFVVNRYLHYGFSLEREMSFGYLWFPASAGDRYLVVGPMLGVGSSFTKAERWDDAHAYWIGAGWAGLGLERSRPLAAGRRLRLSASLALAGLISRPPVYRLEKQDPLNRLSFFVFDTHRDSTLEGPLGYQRARLAVDFERAKQKRQRPRSIGAEVQLVRAADPAPAFAFQTSIRFSTRWGTRR